MISFPDELPTFEVLPHPPESLWQRLDAAITQAQAQGAQASHGVLVRRLDWGQFDVSVSAHVPRGIIYEADDWNRRIDSRTPANHHNQQKTPEHQAGIG